jgi:hypothetical protein
MRLEPELVDLTTMPIEQLSAMVALLTQVEAIARSRGARSLDIADGLADELKRYRAEIDRRNGKISAPGPCLRLVVDNARRRRV